MRWANGNKMTMVLLVVLVAVLLASDVAQADFTFGEPENLGALVNSPGVDASPCVTPDGLQLYYGSDREGGFGGVDLWMSTRPTTGDKWGDPVNLGELFNTPDWDIGPSLSANGLEFYYTRLNYDAWTGELWVAKRASIDDPWGEPTSLGATVNTATVSCGPCISPDGTALYFYQGDLTIWMTSRATILDAWGPPANLGSLVNSGAADYWPHIAANGLVLLFCSGRGGGEDVWMARRPTLSDPWSEPVPLAPPANTEAWDTCPFVSVDGLTYYFVSDRAGGQGSYDLWQAPIEPIVDLDGDGALGRVDIDIMLENWGTNGLLCDIGPTPFGDGVVDVKDLIVLVEHMVAEVSETE